jgi:hypothetical protein
MKEARALAATLPHLQWMVTLSHSNPQAAQQIVNLQPAQLMEDLLRLLHQCLKMLPLTA